MSEQRLILQDIARMQVIAIRIDRTVDDLRGRLDAWAILGRRLVQHIATSITHAQHARKSFATCGETIETIAETLRDWKSSSAEIAVEASDWNMRAKSALHEIGEAIAERDVAHDRLSDWVAAADQYADAVDQWIAPPASMASALDGLRDVTATLRAADPALTEDLIGAINGLRTQTEADVMGAIHLIGKARTRARQANLPLRHARDRISVLQRQGIAGQDELGVAVNQLERFTADVEQNSMRVDDFDTAVKQLGPLIDDLGTRIDQASKGRTTTRRRLSDLVGQVAERRDGIERAAQVATSRLDDGIRERKALISQPSAFMAGVDAIIDSALIDVPDYVGQAISDAIPEQVKADVRAKVASVRATLLEHAEAVTYLIRRTVTQAEQKLPRVIRVQLENAYIRRTGQVPVPHTSLEKGPDQH